MTTTKARAAPEAAPNYQCPQNVYFSFWPFNGMNFKAYSFYKIFVFPFHLPYVSSMFK